MLRTVICALQGNLDLYIPRKRFSRPQSQSPHSCVCERFIYSCCRSNYLPAVSQNRAYPYRPRSSFSGNICFEFSVLYLCRVLSHWPVLSCTLLYSPVLPCAFLCFFDFFCALLGCLVPSCTALSCSVLQRWILGRNPDKCLKGFPPCYSITPTACLEICISSNSRNLLQFLERRKEENLIENHTPFPMV